MVHSNFWTIYRANYTGETLRRHTDGKWSSNSPSNLMTRPLPSGLKDNLPPFWPRNPVMDPTTWTGMFPSKVFKISECGTYMIHRENGWTIKDCRTEQRQRWSTIRHAERMKREKKEREETVARWRERKCMKREDHPAPDVLGATSSR